MFDEKYFDNLFDATSLQDICGQLLCYDIYDKDDPVEVEKIVAKIRPGGIFVSNMPAEKIKLYTDMVNKYAKLPVIVSADVENGPENGVKGGGLLPFPMAWGACDDPELIAKAGKITARISRASGIHWTFAPVVDLNLNFRSPETNVRAVSDNADTVIKIAGAYADGLRSEGLMVTGAKHFPGAGTDERNSHFCTCVNPLSVDDWHATYGKVYREMIARGTESIMVGHYCLPSLAADDEKDKPAILCKSLMTDLLKGELGFRGCIVSDAMSMVGACAYTDPEKLAVQFVQAGGDMVLFPESTDLDNLVAAVRCGDISRERLRDAFLRIMRLKVSAGLFADDLIVPDATPDDLHAVAQQIADKSVTVVRNEKGIVPAKLKRGDKVLVVVMAEPYWHDEATAEPYLPLKQTFEAFGCPTDILVNVRHKKIQSVMADYAVALVVCDMSSKNYHGGSLRIGWYNIMTFWRGYILKHPKMIFASLGDPYKLFDFPFLGEYINVYSDTAESQIALAKAICGTIVATGKSPVSLDFNAVHKLDICK